MPILTLVDSKKSLRIQELDALIDSRANELVAQEEDLKKSMSRFGVKALEMVMELQDVSKTGEAAVDQNEKEEPVKVDQNEKIQPAKS